MKTVYTSKTPRTRFPIIITAMSFIFLTAMLGFSVMMSATLMA